MHLVDSHCHLDFDDFTHDFSQILQRAENASIKTMLTIATRLDNLTKILKIIEKYPNIYGSVGIHPSNVQEHPPFTAEDIIKIAEHEKIIAIGETGLDFHYNYTEKDMQINAFREHIFAAQETKLPIIIHTRNADVETINILQTEMKKKGFTGLIHCFSTSYELAIEAMKLGLYISISGIVTFKKAEALQKIVSELPLAKLLLETDSPYLAPTPYRGRRNEPAFVLNIAEFMSSLMQTDIETIADKTTSNFFKLFTKAKCPKII